MARNIETYDDDEENEDEKPVERPGPRAVPPVPAPVELPASPEAAAAAMEEKPMSPIEEVVHRAGPRTGGKIFPFKRKIAGMGAVPPRLPEGAVLSPEARITPTTEMTRVNTDTMRLPEPEVILVPVAPTPAPTSSMVGLIMGLVAIGGAVFLASMLSGSGEMGEADDEGPDEEDDQEEDDGDSELERALAAPIELAAPPKPKARRKKAAKLEEDVIEGEIVEEDAA